MGEDSGRGIRGPDRPSSPAGWIIGGVIVIALIVIAYVIFAGKDTATPRGQGMITGTTASMSLT